MAKINIINIHIANIVISLINRKKKSAIFNDREVIYSGNQGETAPCAVKLSYRVYVLYRSCPAVVVIRTDVLQVVYPDTVSDVVFLSHKSVIMHLSGSESSSLYRFFS